MGIAEGGLDRLGAPDNLLTSPIEDWAMNLPMASATKKGKIFLPDEAQTKYKGIYPVYTVFVAPVMNVRNLLIGTDKLGHFLQIGYYYFCRVNKNSMPSSSVPDFIRKPDGSMYLIDDSTEMGQLGLGGPSGVFSNADIAANIAGQRLYGDLLTNPKMGFEISQYMSDKWNEAINPSFYLDGPIAHGVWTNLLNGRWTGLAAATKPGQLVAVTVDLQVAGGGDTISGTYSFQAGKSATKGNLKGKVEYLNRTFISDPNGRDAITNVSIEFAWTEDGSSGTGNWDSSGEDKLQGAWGNDAAGMNRGTWSLRHA